MTLLKPNLNYAYPTAVKAEGCRIFDTTGREWIDASSGAIACSIGHGHPAVKAAMLEAVTDLSFVYRTQFTNASAERLSQRLCQRLGYGGAFFVNSGSEAVETAIRLAMQVWRERGKPGKTKIISRRLSYHGATGTALGISGHWPRRRSAGPLSGEPNQPTPYTLRKPSGQSLEQFTESCAEALEQEISQYGKDAIAAFIIEPITGASGAAIVPPDGYLKRMREICDRNDVLLIADEVLTGLGRTGEWLAMDHGGVKADIVCLGKGLNAGYLPISGVLIDERVYESLRAGSGLFPLGHTHSNHPVAAAVANAVLDVLESDNLVSRAKLKGETLGKSLAKLMEKYDFICDVRGAGMLWGLELASSKSSLAPFPPEYLTADTLVQNAFEYGLVIYPSVGFAGRLGGDAVIVAPPLNISDEDLSAIVERLDSALALTAIHLLTRGADIASVASEGTRLATTVV